MLRIKSCLGYPTSHALAAVLKLYEADITSDPLLSSNFINPKTKKVYKVGEQITTRQSFIKTLEILADAEDPVKEFYSGQLMKQMVDEFKQNKGIITEEDFRSYRSILRADTDVIYADFDNKRIRGCGMLYVVICYMCVFRSSTGNANSFNQYM